MRPWLIPVLLASGGPVAAQEKVVEIREEIVVSASLAEVWDSLTTDRGVAGWMGDSATIELRIGGLYEVRHKPQELTEEEKKLAEGEKASLSGMRKTHVLSYIPLQMLSYEGGMEGTWNVWLLDEISPWRVRVRHVGLGTSDVWARMAPMFEKAMNGVLAKLPPYLEKKSPLGR